MLELRDDVEFKEWPKIPRGQKENITITEKMDGTNACIVIEDGKIVAIQSRNKKISPTTLSGDKSSDNMGFAHWVMENSQELVKLGEGYHYGEWVGPGIQDNPHKLGVKKFYLFNVSRWGTHNPNTPTCCSVVPTLYQGEYSHDIIERYLNILKGVADIAQYIPEGIIVYFHKTKRYEKHTFRNQEGKWKE